MPSQLSEYLDQLLDKIFADQQAPEIDPNLIRAYGAKLGEAVLKGYDKEISGIDYDTPDYHTITALQNNVWQFSAAKTHTQLRDIGKALIGADGKIRDKKSFRIEAEQITGTHFKHFDTEYDTAVGGAQMAGKWVQIQADKEALPILEFVAVMDSHTSDICKNLNGVKRLVDDPFWKVWYPPNHYNERGTVKQLRAGDITPLDKIVYPEKIQDMFKVNLGERGLIFPAAHPYYTDVPSHIINNATLYMPVDDQYIIKYKAADGTTLSINRKTDLAQGQDLAQLIEVGKQFADKGYTVDILPEIYATETGLRKALLPDVAEGKNPDLLVNDDYTEVKTPTNPVDGRKIMARISDAAKQADHVVIKLDKIDDVEALKRIAENRFKSHPALKSVTYVTADGEFEQFLNDERR
jgi:SPP1 gp7 family putative phage head morphogenesis protein